MHQTDLVDTLMLCELAGHRPETVVLGLEPADITTLSDALTPVIEARLPALAEAALAELRQRKLM
jgi:hydrogenase maturation protease